MEQGRKKIISEIWTRWKPGEELNQGYSIERICNDMEIFFIILAPVDGRSKIKLVFEQGVDVYRSTQERFRTKSLRNVKATQGKGAYDAQTFFIVYNSQYIPWVMQQSGGLLPEETALQFMHFGIIAVNLVVDVASMQEPKLEFL